MKLVNSGTEYCIDVEPILSFHEAIRQSRATSFKYIKISVGVNEVSLALS